MRFATTTQRHPYQREEIFGPEAALYPITDLDHAISAVNDSDYGLAASVFTSDRRKYEVAMGRIRTGLLNWNKERRARMASIHLAGSAKAGMTDPLASRPRFIQLTRRPTSKAKAASTPQHFHPVFLGQRTCN
jgi:aldehyde dehydrogenase (NAD+)